MARIFITGSTDGLGRAAAESLIVSGRYWYQLEQHPPAGRLPEHFAHANPPVKLRLLRRYSRLWS
jgi:hypothetical protein